MSDVTIHRCTLRIVRHGGWGWGPEPRKLLHTAINALPELLAGELSKLWPNDVELEYATPISIRVPLSMKELSVAAGAGGHLDFPQTSSVTEVLAERIGVAARKALVDELNPLETPAREEISLLADQEDSQVLTAGSGSQVLEVLLSWRRQNVLELRLAAFSLSSLETWLARLVQPAGAASYREACESVDSRTSDVNNTAANVNTLSDASEAIERLVFESARKLHTTLSDREAVIRRRIIVLVDVVLQRGMSECSPELVAALNRALPLDQTEPDHSGNLDLTNAAKQEPFAEAFEYLATAPANDQTGCAPSQSQEKSVRLDSIHKDGESEFNSTASELVDRREEGPGLVSSQSVIDQSDSASVAVPLLKDESRFASRIQRSSSTATPTGAENYSLVLRPHLTTQAPELVRETPGHKQTRHIASVLPFLLLGPLARIGYLKVLGATLEAANAASTSSLFAAALAYKVLAPPERGWRRQPESVAAATAFAGLNQPADEPALVNLARHLSEHLSPLEATLSGVLISGHNQQQPLLLMRAAAEADSGFLLVDVEGIFPIQWAAGLSDLRHSLVQLDSAIVLVPQTSADTTLLRWLDEQGFHFVTDALPIRGERWRAVRRSPRERWWTNEAIASDSALVKVGQKLSDAADEAATLWQALAVERPSIPLAGDKRLDRHLTLAAAVALGTISWELWRSREFPSPCVALERFRDLEASVSYERDIVQVSLPLGKRFNDLRDHRLLDDVADVPWLNGRTLRFSSN